MDIFILSFMGEEDRLHNEGAFSTMEQAMAYANREADKFEHGQLRWISFGLNGRYAQGFCSDEDWSDSSYLIERTPLQ